MVGNNGIHILGTTLSPWIYAPVIFLAWLVILYTAKAIVFNRLKTWAKKIPSSFPAGELFISSLDLPLRILILGGGLAVLARLLPLSQEWNQPVAAVVKVFVIIALFLFLDHLIRQFLKLIAGRVRAVDLSQGLVHGLIRLTVFSFGLLILLDSLGISITPFVASLGIGSLAAALGLQDTLTNLFAGLFVVADQPVRVGDFIRLDSGEEGYIVDIGWRNTRIRTLPNVLIVVPNSKLTSCIIHNYYLPDKEMAMLVEVGVHYASDLKKVEQVTVEVAREVQRTVQGAVSHFEPFIRYHTFGDSSIGFTVILRVREFTDQFLVKHEFIKALQERYKKEGITIPYPIRTLDIPAESLEALKIANRVQL